MKIFDIDDNEITNPDLDLGQLVGEQKQVKHIWIVDVEQQSHKEVVKVYPNGGKDVEFVIDVEEEGHWETRDENDVVIVDFDGFIPDDMPHDQVVSDVWQFQRYVPFTEEELAEAAKRKEEMEAAIAEAEKRDALLNEVPSRIDNTEVAIAELGVVADNNSVSIDDLAQAVAELGVIIAGE